jgi:hypothetical protein
MTITFGPWLAPPMIFDICEDHSETPYTAFRWECADNDRQKTTFLRAYD